MATKVKSPGVQKLKVQREYVPESGSVEIVGHVLENEEDRVFLSPLQYRYAVEEKGASLGVLNGTMLFGNLVFLATGHSKSWWEENVTNFKN